MSCVYNMSFYVQCVYIHMGREIHIQIHVYWYIRLSQFLRSWENFFLGLYVPQSCFKLKAQLVICCWKPPTTPKALKHWLCWELVCICHAMKKIAMICNLASFGVVCFLSFILVDLLHVLQFFPSFTCFERMFNTKAPGLTGVSWGQARETWVSHRLGDPTGHHGEVPC